MRNRHATHNMGSLKVQIQVFDQAYDKCFPTLQSFAVWFQQGNPLEYSYPHRHNVVDAHDLAFAVLHGRIHSYMICILIINASSKC